MSEKLYGISMTENDIRTHLEVLSIADIALSEELECLTEDPQQNFSASISRISGIRRIIEAAMRDLRCTHDYLLDDMYKQGLKPRYT